MTKDEMISVLEMISRFSREYLKRLDDAALEKLYKEKVG